MSNVSDKQWQDVMALVQERHPQTMRGWFPTLRPVSLDGGVLEIAAANEAQRNYLEEQARPAFAEAAQTVTGRLLSIQITVAVEDADPPGDEASTDSHASTQTPDAAGTFNEFVSDPANRLALASAIAVADEPGQTYNPLFLHGEPGMGKTHLLRAIEAVLAARSPAVDCLYLPCELFVSQFIEAEENGILSTLRERYRSVDVLLVDDVQFLRDRERSQEEFFHTFNARIQAHRQIVLACDCAPADLTGVEPRLVSRFGAGLVAEVGFPCTETRMALVRRETSRRCLEVEDEAVRKVASLVTTNVQDLIDMIGRLETAISAGSGTITEAVIDTLMSGAARPPVPLPVIVEAVANRFDVTVEDLQGKKRSRSVTHPRHVSMYLARHLTNKSLEDIGRYFGGRDHTTVRHAQRTIDRLAQTDPVFRALLDEIASDVKNGVY